MDPKSTNSVEAEVLQEFIQKDYSNQLEQIKQILTRIKQLENLQQLNFELQDRLIATKIVITKRYPFIKFKQHEPLIPITKSKLDPEPWTLREIRILTDALPEQTHLANDNHWKKVSEKMATVNFMPRSPAEIQHYYQKNLSATIDCPRTSAANAPRRRIPRRDPLQVFSALKQKQYNKQSWTDAELVKLKGIVKYYGLEDSTRPTDWIMVKSHFDGRRVKDCIKVYQKVKHD